MDKEHFYKISQNTQIVDDVSKEIEGQNKFAKKHTVVHGVNNNKID